jgi:PncC family amidohydrolase
MTAHAEQALKVLKAHKLSVATAESCTAGLIAAALSQAEDAGEWLQGGFITYTKDNKCRALGVDRALLKEKGSVCAEVVCQMAEGALARSPAGMALAISGVLGPSKDEDGNPVGLVFVCAQRRGGQPLVVRRDFAKEHPDLLRRKAVHLALDVLTQAAERS